VHAFSKILVGVDLSNADPSAGIESAPADEAALNCSIVVSHGGHANLTIFACLYPYPYLHEALPSEFARSHLEREAKKILGHFQTRAADAGVEVRAKVAFGIPWEEICREVMNEKYDLVIAGTRDLSRTGRFLFGSTGMKLLRCCPCPVWIARPGTDWRHPRVLVPSDLSDVSLEALRAAVALGEIVDARIYALHALEGPGPPPLWYGRQAQELFKEFAAERRADAKRQLAKQLVQAECDQLPDDLRIHVAAGRPDEAILRAIEDLEIDLVVMGTSARSGLQGLTMGNTTERLVSKMPCSLLAVKPSGFEYPVTTLK
jgi:universal stress protein E